MCKAPIGLWCPAYCVARFWGEIFRCDWEWLFDRSYSSDLAWHKSIQHLGLNRGWFQEMNYYSWKTITSVLTSGVVCRWQEMSQLDIPKLLLFMLDIALTNLEEFTASNLYYLSKKIITMESCVFLLSCVSKKSPITCVLINWAQFCFATLMR